MKPSDGGTKLVQDHNGLSEAERAAVRKYRNLNWSYQGIARRLDLPPSSVAKFLGIPQIQRVGDDT